MKILIVEDDFGSRKLIQAILNGISEYDVAVNGKEGLEAYKQSIIEKKKYDLILLDIMMPEMDGQSVLKNIREHEKEKNIWGEDSVKIIMMTALGDKENIREAFAEQCEGYIIKPIKKQVLLTEMKRAGIEIS